MAKWPYNTARWQRLRAQHLHLEPFCRGCDAAGREPVLANTVDHVHPISEGGSAFPPHDGLASYCASCHSAKTARGAEAGAVRTARAIQPRRGCDEHGNPLDPAHPWVTGKSLRAATPRTVTEQTRSISFPAADPMDEVTLG